MKKNNLSDRFLVLALAGFSILVCPAAQAQTAPKTQAGDNSKPYTYVEQMPQFKGGETEMLKFLGSNIRYPQEARDAGIEGLVVLSFIVEKDGALKDIEVLKKLGGGTDEEAMRVVKLMSGQWLPGKQGGKPVDLRYTLPVRFALSQAEQAATASIANRMPQFKGGPEALMRVIQQHLQLPTEAAQENLSARVVVKFTVEKDGSVSNIKLAQTKLKKTIGPGSELDYMDASTFGLQNKAILAKLSEAAATAVKATSGQWEPSRKDGQPIAAELALPIQFVGADATGINQQPDALRPTELHKKKDIYNYEEVDIKPTMKDMPLEKFLGKNLRFPAGSSFEGDVQVDLIIKEDGRLAGPMTTIVEDRDITEEIYRVFKLTESNWLPGEMNGQPVSTVRHLTIRFIVDDGTEKQMNKAASKADVIVNENEVLTASGAKNSSLVKFLAANLRYPATQAEGTAVVKFDLTENGWLHYQMSPGFNDAMGDEVIRVLKLAKDKGLLAQQQNKATPALQSLTISFKKNNNRASTGNKATIGPDVTVIRYAPIKN